MGRTKQVDGMSDMSGPCGNPKKPTKQQSQSLTKSNGEKKKYQCKGYPGLENMAPYIVPHFPKKFSVYVEPFAGLARTAPYIEDKADFVVLNDMSDRSVSYLREKFDYAHVTQEDFQACIRRWDSKDTFFLIDPPWRYNIYDENDGPVINMKPVEYYQIILDMAKTMKGKWLLCCDRAEKEIRHLVSHSGYPNVVLQHPTKVLYGRPCAVRMCGNYFKH